MQAENAAKLLILRVASLK